MGRGPAKGRPTRAAAVQTDGLRALFQSGVTVATLLLLPALLLLLNDQWAFPGPVRDPWIYLGYYKAAPEYLKAFTGAYFSTRLSVILPGWILFSILPSLAANVVLHLLVCWASLFFFYGTVRLFFGPHTALLCSVALGCHSFFLIAVGENYVDGFGIAYSLGAILFCALAARPPGRPGHLVAAGAFATALVAANLFYVVFLPFVAVLFVVLNREGARRPLLPGLALALGGAGGLFVLLCGISKLLGGRFLFILGSTSFAASLLRQANPFRQPPQLWLSLAVWLALPAAALLGTIATLARISAVRPTAGGSALALSQALYVSFALMMIAWQCSTRAPVLQLWYYTSLMLPLAFLALAGQVSRFLTGSRGKAGRFVAISALVLVAPWAITVSPSRLLAIASPALVLPLLAGTVAVGLLSLGPPRGALLIVALGFLSILSLSGRDLFPYNSGFARYGGDKKQIFLQLDHAVDAYRRYDRTAGLFFGFDQNEDLGTLYDMIAATSLSGARIVSMGFPEILHGMTANGTPVRTGMKIAVLSTNGMAFRMAEDALRRLNLRARQLGVERIEGPAGPFDICILEVCS